MNNKNFIEPGHVDSVAKAATGVKNALLLIPLLLLWQTASFASAPGIPPDGFEQPFWTVDTEIDSVTPPKSLTDLSEATFLSLDFVKYRVYGDSLMCVAREGYREWYSARGDSLWRVGWNDRHRQGRFDCGLLYLPPYGHEIHETAQSDSLTVTSSPARIMRAEVNTVFSAEMAGGFVMPNGDTIPSSWLVVEKDATANSAMAARHRRWYAPGNQFPVVECVELPGQNGGVIRIVTVCPPSEQAQTPRVAKAKARGYDSADTAGIDSPQNLTEGIKVSVDRAAHTIRISHSGGTDVATTTIRLYDTLGRLMAEGTGLELALPGLPRGSYAIEITMGGKSSSAKIWIE